MKRTYDFGSFAPGGVKADEAYRELERIRAETGTLLASAVVDAAADEDSPLHPAFDWDDASAGREYRLIQARHLIRAVRVTVGTKEPRRVYVHVGQRSDEEGVYEPMDVVVKSPDRYALALIELRRRLNSAQEAFEELRQAGEASGDRDRLALLAMAAEALAAANSAVKALH